MKQFGHIDWSSLGPLRKSLKDPETGNPYTQAHVAKVAKCSQSYIARIEKGQDMVSPDTAIVEGIARALKMPLESLMQQLDKKTAGLPIQDRPKIVQITNHADVSKIPKYAGLYDSPAIRETDIIKLEDEEFIEAPPFLKNEPDAYAVEIVGPEMWPRYFEGDILYVNPNSQVFPGDDAVIQFKHLDRWVCMVREVVAQEGMYSENAGDEPDMQRLYVHTLEEKANRTYRGDFRDDKPAFDDLMSYRDKASYIDNDGEFCKAHPVVGVKKFRQIDRDRPRFNATSILAEQTEMKVEGQEANLKVERAEKK
jgi:transcriptional regulator with XRE-family HTH domain